VIFLGVGNKSEFFTLKLMGMSFSIYEFSPYKLFSSNELRSSVEEWVYVVLHSKKAKFNGTHTGGYCNIIFLRISAISASALDNKAAEFLRDNTSASLLTSEDELRSAVSVWCWYLLWRTHWFPSVLLVSFPHVRLVGRQIRWHGSNMLLTWLCVYQPVLCPLSEEWTRCQTVCFLLLVKEEPVNVWLPFEQRKPNVILMNFEQCSGRQTVRRIDSYIIIF
jgi:hypothetical protein